jgi:hypothetical protein
VGWASAPSRRLGFGSKARRSARRRSSLVSAHALGERGPLKGGEMRSGWQTGHRTTDWGCCGDDGLGVGWLGDRLVSGRSRALTGVRAANWALGEEILATGQRRDRDREALVAAG